MSGDFGKNQMTFKVFTMKSITQYLDPALIREYEATDYCFTTRLKTIVIRPGDFNEALHLFMEQERITQWAYLTAWNPFSIPMPARYNHAQQERLRQAIRSYTFYSGEGRGRMGNWPAEESYFVAGISKAAACKLGRHFGQAAILLSDEKGQPRLEQLYQGYTLKVSDGSLFIKGMA